MMFEVHLCGLVVCTLVLSASHMLQGTLVVGCAQRKPATPYPMAMLTMGLLSAAI